MTKPVAGDKRRTYGRPATPEELERHAARLERKAQEDRRMHDLTNDPLRQKMRLFWESDAAKVLGWVFWMGVLLFLTFGPPHLLFLLGDQH